MAKAEQLITENLELWSSAVKAKSSAGRGSSKKLELYGIANLRELIIQFAIQGKLVPNNSDEAPIPHDLHNDLDSINHQNPPPNWRTLLLSDGIKNKSGNSKLIKGKLLAEPAPGLFQGFSAAGPDVWCENFEYEGNAVIVSAVGARCGKAFKATGKWCAIANTNICWPDPDLFTLGFACLILDNENFWIRSGSAQPFVKFPPSLKRNFSLPPLSEQHRIVAKVNELMALCDQLEQEQENNLETHETLVSSLLNALTSTTTDASQFAEAWQFIQSNFDILFTTEHSVDQLKQAILQLAVMGKLVPQDPEDEPADELLNKVAKEKDNLIKAKKASKQKRFPAVSTRDFPYSIPSNWTWCHLGQTGIGFTGKTPKTSNSNNFGGSIQFIGPGQITPSGRFLEAEKTITESGLEESTEAIAGDILMVCIGGSIGKSAITKQRLAFNQQINSLRPIGLSAEYLKAAISTDDFLRSVIDNSTGSATPIINRNKWENLLVPIPPLAEQRRIVAKVDALMALCDQLKANLASAQITQLNLADSLVEQAIQ